MCFEKLLGALGSHLTQAADMRCSWRAHSSCPHGGVPGSHVLDFKQLKPWRYDMIVSENSTGRLLPWAGGRRVWGSTDLCLCGWEEGKVSPPARRTPSSEATLFDKWPFERTEQAHEHIPRNRVQ